MRFHITGRMTILLLLAAPLMALGNWLPTTWLVGFYLVVMVALMVADWRWAGDISRFQVTRTHDTKLSLGASNPIYLEVRNRWVRGVRFWLRDEPPDQFEIEKLLFEGDLGGRASWTETYHVTPRRRGDYMFGDMVLRWRGPLGLVVREGMVEAAGGVKVYPNLLAVRRYELLLRQNRLHEMGLRSARMLGQGTEFERLREYTPDDEYRRINWKATARRRRPIATQYQTERSQNIIAVLDTGRMMQTPVAQIAKLDYVINAVLLLGYVATGMGDKVGLMTFADEVQSYLNPRQGQGQFYRMLETLYGIEPQRVEPNYQRGLSYLASKHRKRSLIIIFTDLSGGMTMDSLVSHVSLLAKRNLPLVVTISDPEVVAAAAQKPEDSLGVYQRAAANQLLWDRQVALDTLRRQGVLTLDLPANQLSFGVINRYLELKGRGRL
ncbi:MAG TPA: DUF58 domain-containing protein [Anaerolineae bacterium]|nr:DUF58 domain-containing protein [Anaerolineae bacterium]